MKVLIVCSGNFADFSLEKHQAFIYDQVNAISKHYSHIDFSVFPINGQGIMGYLKNLKLLKETIRKEKVDLIHAHFSLSGMLSVLQRKVPVIVTFHGSDINLPKINLISSVVSLFSTYSIFVSTALHDNIYIKRRKKHNFIIPCGVDFEIFKPIDKIECKKKLNLDLNKKYILFSSRFDNAVKNYDLTKKSIELLNDDKIQVLELYGYKRDEVNLFLNASDMAIMTSHSEGSPQFVKEAMACNRPIISTKVGDVYELFGNTKGCYLVAYDAHDVLLKVKQILESGSSTNGRQNIQHLANDKIAKKIVSVYNNALSI